MKFRRAAAECERKMDRQALLRQEESSSPVRNNNDSGYNLGRIVGDWRYQAGLYSLLSEHHGLPGTAYTNLRGVALVAPWVMYLGAADIALSLLLPVKLFAPDLVYRVSSWIAYSVWRWVQGIFEVGNGAQIHFHGDVLPQKESAIIVSNHVSWTDFYMIQALAQRSGMLGQCRWFAKIQLRAVPFLGWGLWAMGLISFSEATRFTAQKYEESKIWCKQNGRPQPLHLLYPRTKGFIKTVQHLRKAPHVKAVYDFTIAYQHRNRFLAAPDMWQTLKLPNLTSVHGYQFHVMARRYPLDELPHTDEELAKWLEERWVEKGEWLESRRLEWASK
ncbi:Uu.00g044450.m01.CDS01 [Anthostomella pinea]|uniref:Uu.00g044450.m01.CDS01 n=1 Tax=Anthostomella pinea TaxID=933095 RepID=A0AAI8VBG8_9PEZI|nr:Uu.00g044450.m01.CDS01 [Anthostomella pinea]